MGKTLILGATGTISGLAADALYQSSPETLRVATSRERKLPRLEARFPGAEVVLADWNDEDSLVKAMDGVSKVMVVTPDFVTDEHVVTPNIINAAKRVGSIELIARIIAIPPGYRFENERKAYVDTRIGSAMHAIAKSYLDASGLPIAYVNVPGWIMFMIDEFFAPEVKASRRLAMPAGTDAKRMWVSEIDIAAVFAKVLSDPAERHAGAEHVLTAPIRQSFEDVARALSAALHDEVTYVIDDEPLRAIMKGGYETLMTYLDGDGERYASAVPTDTIEGLLGRPQETLDEYVARHADSFR